MDECTLNFGVSIYSGWVGAEGRCSECEGFKLTIKAQNLLAHIPCVQIMSSEHLLT